MGEPEIGTCSQCGAKSYMAAVGGWCLKCCHKANAAPVRLREENATLRTRLATLEAEVLSLKACIGTMRGVMRSDLPAEDISAEHVERYTHEVCRFTPTPEEPTE